MLNNGYFTEDCLHIINYNNDGHGDECRILRDCREHTHCGSITNVVFFLCVVFVRHRVGVVMMRGNYWQHKQLQRQRERKELLNRIAWVVVLILLPPVVVWMQS